MRIFAVASSELAEAVGGEDGYEVIRIFNEKQYAIKLVSTMKFVSCRIDGTEQPVLVAMKRIIFSSTAI